MFKGPRGPLEALRETQERRATPVRKAPKDPPVFKAPLGRRAPQAPAQPVFKEPQVFKAKRAPKVPPELGLPEFRERRVSKGPLDRKGPQALAFREPLAFRVPRDIPARALQVLKGPPVFRGRKGRLVFKEQLARLAGPKVILVLRELPAPKDLKVRQEQGLQGLMVPRVSPDPKGLKEPRAAKVPPELDRRAPKDLLVRLAGPKVILVLREQPERKAPRGQPVFKGKRDHKEPLDRVSREPLDRVSREQPVPKDLKVSLVQAAEEHLV